MADYVPPYLAAPNYDRPAFDPKAAEGLAKPRPRLLVKREAQSKVKTEDQQERDKCHVRSLGQCEVWETFIPIFVFEKKTMKSLPPSLMVKRCKRRASENHHLIGGIGRRNKGKSILAEHRLDCCAQCHKDITGNVLIPVDGTKKEDAATVRYERAK